MLRKRKPIRVIQIIYVISIMCMLCLLLTACGSKTVYVVPAEVYYSRDLTGVDEDDINLGVINDAASYRRSGECKAMEYKDGYIYITMTDKQAQKWKNGMIEYLAGDDETLSLLYSMTGGNPIRLVSDDYKELWYRADDKDAWNSDKEIPLSTLLFLQILDGESYETAKVTVHVAFSDDTQSDFEYTCDNFYKDSED